jgi:hypothetical protein
VTLLVLVEKVLIAKEAQDHYSPEPLKSASWHLNFFLNLNPIQTRL